MKPEAAKQMVILIQSLSVEDATRELMAFMKGKSQEQLVFPFESPNFAHWWGKIVSEPKWKRKTHNAYQMALHKLSEYSEEIAIQAIKDAIAGGYQGIFPENVKLKGVIFETEAQKRLRQNKNVSDALMNGDIQWKQ